MNRTILGASTLAAAALAAAPASAQYISGSDGSLGDLAPVDNTVVSVPPDGVLHYATVNIPVGVTVSFSLTGENGPVYLLATGDVTVNGTITVSGENGVTDTSLQTLTARGGRGGPGGGRGAEKATTGDGIQGGQMPAGAQRASANCWCGAGGASLISYPPGGADRGVPVGQPGWLPLRGGSGGGSNPNSCQAVATAGGGGGGVLVLASSADITINGSLLALGGNGTINGASQGGGGGGGVLRLAANTITLGGAANLDARGGSLGGYSNCPTGNAAGGPGMIRFESFNLVGYAPARTNPLPYINTTPLQALPPFPLNQVPTVTITAVNGVAPGGVLGAYPPNIVLATGVPLTVDVRGRYIPLGTVVKVRARPIGFAHSDVNSTPLSGTLADSTASAVITLPAGARLGSVDAWIDSLPVP